MKELKWFDTDNCEYPDIEEYTECAHVWLFNGQSVEHAFYKNPSIDVCYFVDLDGEIINATRWAEFTPPNNPK